MTTEDSPDQQSDNASRAASAWALLKGRVQTWRTRDVAASVAAKVVAGAIATALAGGAVVTTSTITANRAVERAYASAAALQTVEANVTELEAEAAELRELSQDLNSRIEGLTALLSATDAINDQQVERVLLRIGDVAKETREASAKVNARVSSLTAALSKVQVDLANVIINQNDVGAALEGVAERVAAIADDLSDVQSLAASALSEALIAQGFASRANEKADNATGLANEALGAAARVAEDVAALADQVGALAEEVAANADALADLAARVDDLEDRMAAEEAEQPVSVTPYNDEELRERIDQLEHERVFVYYSGRVQALNAGTGPASEGASFLYAGLWVGTIDVTIRAGTCRVTLNAPNGTYIINEAVGSVGGHAVVIPPFRVDDASLGYGIQLHPAPSCTFAGFGTTFRRIGD